MAVTAKCAKLALALALALSATLAAAADLALVGLLPGKAIVVINGGARQILATGESSREGVRLIEVGYGEAVFNFEGDRRRLRIGQSIVSSRASGEEGVSIEADNVGRFIVDGMINGIQTRILVREDSDAPMLTLGGAVADHIGLPWRTGRSSFTSTENGKATVWLVRLDELLIGPIRMQDVEAMVRDDDLPYVLLGANVLKRLRIEREDQQLKLTQQY